MESTVLSNKLSKERQNNIEIENKISNSIFITLLIGIPATIGLIVFARTNIKFIISKCNRRY